MKQLIALLSILISTASFGQTFEGKITYESSFESAHPDKVTPQEWTNLIGWKQELYIKNGNYKYVTNGSFCQWKVYVNADNKIYTKVEKSDTLLWNDASLYSEKIIAKTSIKKNAVKILGYSCDQISFALMSGGAQTYFFASKLGVDVKQFEQHKFGLWLDFLSQSKALPLKSRIETTQFVMESVATEVKAMQLDDAFFAVPGDGKIKKNPRNLNSLRGTWLFQEMDR